MSPRKKPAPPPEPATRTLEGFWTDSTPDPRAAEVRPSPSAYSGFAVVYRYKVTVERIEEPDAVILARMVGVWRAAESRARETLEREARRRFKVDIKAMAEKGGAS